MILETGIPDIERQELIHRIRESRASMPVVIFTAWEPGERAPLAMGADGQAQLFKLFGTEKLLQFVNC